MKHWISTGLFLVAGTLLAINIYNDESYLPDFSLAGAPSIPMWNFALVAGLITRFGFKR